MWHRVWTVRILELLAAAGAFEQSLPLQALVSFFIKGVNIRHLSLAGEMDTQTFTTPWSEPGRNEAVWHLAHAPRAWESTSANYGDDNDQDDEGICAEELGALTQAAELQVKEDLKEEVSPS